MQNISKEIDRAEELWLIDFHNHIYCNYSTSAWAESTYNNLLANEQKLLLSNNKNSFKKVRWGVVLAEHSGLNFFSPISNGKYSELPVVDKTKQWCTVRIKDREVVIFSAMQIVSREGLEFLTLTPTKLSNKGMNWQSIVHGSARAGEGVGILWGIGKWWLKRRKTVEAIINYCKEEKIFLVLVDSRLRASSFFFDNKFFSYKNNWVKTAAGSDPLPLQGDEKSSAQLASLCLLPRSLSKREISLKNILSLSETIQTVGKRESVFPVINYTVKSSFIWR
ncbi:MAG: hypothetical protein D6780_04355 [Candidatus Dadabacteria bacterium]|nr:MAG: hypothetical protein D6780_04355 [Candidatus Dadabacteria bacterium]